LVLPGHQQHPARELSRLDLSVCLRTFHWMFTRAHHANIHFNTPFHLSLGLSSGLFPSAFPTRMLYTPLLYPICDVPHAPSASFFLIWSLNTWWRTQSMTPLIIQILPVPCYLIPLRPSSAPYSQTLSVYQIICIQAKILQLHLLAHYTCSHLNKACQKIETYHKYSLRMGSGHGSGWDGWSTWGRGGGIGACRCPQRPEYWMHILWHAIEHLSHL
jgi:hypothetical protein